LGISLRKRLLEIEFESSNLPFPDGNVGRFFKSAIDFTRGYVHREVTTGLGVSRIRAKLVRPLRKA